MNKTNVLRFIAHLKMTDTFNLSLSQPCYQKGSHVNRQSICNAYVCVFHSAWTLLCTFMASNWFSRCTNKQTSGWTNRQPTAKRTAVKVLCAVWWARHRYIQGSRWTRNGVWFENVYLLRWKVAQHGRKASNQTLRVAWVKGGGFAGQTFASIIRPIGVVLIPKTRHH